MPRPLPAAIVLVFAVFVAPARGGVVQPFPDGFLWGTAISAFQSEMGVGAPNDANTDWWVWAHDTSNISGGRVSGDEPETGPGFYALYGDDAQLARHRLASNALRMSIEWSRIFPSSTAGGGNSSGGTPPLP